MSITYWRNRYDDIILYVVYEANESSPCLIDQKTRSVLVTPCKYFQLLLWWVQQLRRVVHFRLVRLELASLCLAD